MTRVDATGWAIVGTLIGSPVLGVLVGKYFRPNATPLEMIQEIQEERDADRRRLDRLEQTQRVTLDYVHDLRQHIADGKPPPPPPWPEGLRA